MQNPPPHELDGQPGSFRMPVWNVLGYLERVSGQLNGNDGSIAENLMEVVRAIADFRNEKGERIDNYHADYTLIKVMANVARSTGHREN